jgi:hypothetical protein
VSQTTPGFCGYRANSAILKFRMPTRCLQMEKVKRGQLAAYSPNHNIEGIKTLRS